VDAIGVKNGRNHGVTGCQTAQWVYDMLAASNESFYKVQNGQKLYYDIPSQSYKAIPAGSLYYSK
jgi:3-hydroxyacyl-CoA dehydrogenase